MPVVPDTATVPADVDRAARLAAAIADPARLAALDALAVLGTEPETEFDDIVRLATRIIAAPFGLVTLISANRQYFKAGVGINERETDLGQSVCRYALLEPDLLVIPDLAADPRTAHFPMVSGPPNLRFYAGAPLRMPSGDVVGSLCILDTAPRPAGLPADAAENLRALARQVVRLLAMRRERIQAALSLAESETRARLAQETGRIGTFEVDVATGRIGVSPQFARIYGLPTSDRYVAGTFEALIVPEDRSIASTVSTRGGGTAAPEVEYRIRRADDGALRWITRRASFARDAAGRVTRMSGTVQDSTEEHRVRDELARVAERLRLAVDATRIGIFDYDVVAGELTWDGQVRELFGVAAGAPVTYADTFLAGVHPDDRADADAAVQAALDPAGPGVFDVEYRVVPLDGSPTRWLAARGQAVVTDGRTVRFVGTVRDVTVRRQAEDAMRSTEERYRHASSATNDAVWDWDLAADHVLWNEAMSRTYGHAAEAIEPNGAWWVGHIHPDDRERIAHGIHDVIAGSGTAWSDEYRFRRADGTHADVIDRGYVIRDAAGRARRMIGAMLDITERKVVHGRTAAMVELGDRLRAAPTGAEAVATAAKILARTLAVSRGGYARLDPTRNVFEVEGDFAAPGLAAFEARPDLATFAATLGELREGRTVVVADVAARPGMVGLSAIGTGALVEVPLIERGDLVGVLFAHATEPRAWTAQEIAFARGVADRTHAALARLRAEREQRMRNEELSHRLKNTLAMVLSIANQTLRVVPERAPVQAFEQRIHALSSAHDVLLRQSWTAAPIREVVDAVVAGSGHAERIDASGPDLKLGPRATLSLSLVLHELATNAAKYGALSGPSGRVGVSWRVAEADDGAEVVLDWTERGGPPIAEPERQGFGSRLIRTGLVGSGGVELRYPEVGFEATMRAPLAQLQRS